MNKSCLERRRGDARSDYCTTDVVNKVRARVKKMENNVNQPRVQEMINDENEM